MRVIIPILALEFGGERIIAEIANGLVARGHEAILVVPYGGRIAWPIRANVAWVPALTPENIPPGDIIMPNFYPTVLPAFRSRKGRCVRLSLAYEPLWVNKPEAALSYNLPMPVIVISEWQRQQVARRSAGPFYLLHPGVDQSVFHPYPKPADGAKRLLYLLRTRHYHWKGQADFVAAHAMLARAFPELQVSVVRAGGGIEEASYPLPCAWRSARDDWEMGRLYAEADIFVYPSHFESFGLPPLEAMACGCPVITSPHPALAEVCGEAALYLKSHEPSGIAGSMKRLIGNLPLREELRRLGTQRARRFSWSETARRTRLILEQGNPRKF